MNNLIFKKDWLILALIISTIILLRVFTIWIGRPEFVGWFSHTYYYFVEVQGVLQNNSLVYSDMPLLFYIYAIISKILIYFGVAPKLAIVTSTRLVMSVTPALTALPVYFLIKLINKGKHLTKLHWLLVLVSTLLPLSITHLPEILQKNMFGLVLFTFLQLAIYKLLKTYSHIKMLCVFILTLSILLTHLGTFGVTLFFFVAVITATFITKERADKKTLLWLFSTPIFAGFSIYLIYLIDVSRFNRIVYYLGRSISNSQIGKIYSSETIIEKLQFLAAAIFTTLVVYLLYRLYKLKLKELPKIDKIFLLSNIIFIYLLLFPLFDVDLIVRFILFISLPIIIIQIYLLKYLQRNWVKNALVGLFVLVCATMTFGEVMGVLMRNANNRLIHQEIVTIKNKHIFESNDFVITKYGVNPICNWFFEIKSGLITSLNKTDFQNHRKVYILNPIEGRISPETVKNLTNKPIITESEKYEVMRNNIIIPKQAKPVYTSETIEIFELESPPKNWKFDSNGNWVGYSNLKR